MRKDDVTVEQWEAFKKYQLAWYYSHKLAVSVQRRVRYKQYSGEVIAKVHAYRRSEHGQSKIKARMRSIKALAMDKLGGARCLRCGCEDIRALEINHKNGGGAKEVRETNKYGIYMWKAILEGKRDTSDLNVLCRVCNNLEYMERKYPELRDKWEVVWNVG